jgi:hypothetical protein
MDIPKEGYNMGTQNKIEYLMKDHVKEIYVLGNNLLKKFKEDIPSDLDFCIGTLTKKNSEKIDFSICCIVPPKILFECFYSEEISPERAHDILLALSGRKDIEIW